MKLKFISALVASMFLLLASSAFSASISFVKKEPADSSGKFNYSYKYTCTSRAGGTLTVSSATDNEAKQLAEVKAKRICEEN